MSFEINKKLNYSDPEIEKIISIEGNSRCIDCGSDDPQWASLKNSVFVCSNCSVIHRSLGNEISEIRSLVSDKWDDKQLKQLFLGGNIRFIANLEDFGIVKNNNHLSLNPEKIEKKYLYIASEYYRQVLSAELNMNESPKKPDMLKGCELIIQKELEKPGDSVYTIEQDNNDEAENEEEEEVEENNDNSENNTDNNNIVVKQKKSIKDKISGFFSTAAKKTKKTYKKLEEKVSQLHIKEKLKQTGEKTVSLAKDTGKYISTKATQAKVSLFCFVYKIF